MLAEICSEEWVLQKCLQNPDELYQPDMLLDSMLTPRQAQRYKKFPKYENASRILNLKKKLSNVYFFKVATHDMLPRLRQSYTTRSRSKDYDNSIARSKSPKTSIFFFSIYFKGKDVILIFVCCFVIEIVFPLLGSSLQLDAYVTVTIPWGLLSTE